MKKVLAMLLALCMMLGVAGMAAAEEEIVTLKWVTVGNGMPANYDSWIAQVNEYVGEKIGVNIEMQVIGWGDWEPRRNVIINTNEPYDIIFGNDATYNNDVRLGAYYEITEEDLNTYAPGLLELIPADYWDAVRVNGKIYAVPSYKDSSMTNYFVWDKDLLDANGLDTTEMHDLAAVEETLYALKDLVNIAPFTTNGNGNGFILANYDSLSSGLPALGVRVDDESRQVVAVFEQEDIMETLTMFHKWFNDGIINQDANVSNESYKQCFFGSGQGWPSAVIGWAAGQNLKQYDATDPIDGPFYTSATTQGSINCLYANCKNPDAALKFLELVNTDNKLRDMLTYGKEGVDFEYQTSEDGRTVLHQITTDNYKGPASYAIGSFFSLSLRDTEPATQWDEIKQQNEEAVDSVCMGFTLDTSNIETEITACASEWATYKADMLTGARDPKELVPELKERLKSAGIDTIIAEAQKQVDAYFSK